MDFTYKPSIEKECRNCGLRGGKHAKGCAFFYDYIKRELNKFIMENAQYLQEKKLDERTKGWMKELESAEFTMEQRYNLLKEMKREREKILEKFGKPIKDVQNEIELIDNLMNKIFLSSKHLKE